MNFNKLTAIASALTLATGLSACGGGGGSASSGTTGTAAVGTITGFGSVFVNGVEYETSGASIRIDGQTARENDLAVGMVAEVSGVSAGSSGTAISINVDDELEGVVLDTSGIAADGTGSMNIMGQTVTLDTNTLFDSNVPGIADPTQVAAGNVVEVNGYSDGNGNVIATRIEVKAQDMASYGGTIELKGVVRNLDTAALRFDIGGLSVDYSAASRVDGALAEGLYVEVKSDRAPTMNPPYTLTASSVEREDDGRKGHQGDEGEDFEIKGMIATVSGDNFTLMDGTAVITDASTQFEHGSVNDLATNVMVEVEGYFDADGNLVANEINFEDDGYTNQSEYRGTVTNISVTPGTVNIGSVTMTLGDGSSQTFVINNNTIMKDSSTNGEHRFNLQALETALLAGQTLYVEINAYVDTATGDNVAVKLEREDSMT